jgi:hypothetical protein
MASGLWAAVIGGLSGLVTSSTSVAVVWARWSIEKRRMDRERRYALLDSWRAGIAREGSAVHTAALHTSWYETLRPYLASGVVERLEAPRTVIVSPDSPRGTMGIFTSEVDRIEREWGLRP